MRVTRYAIVQEKTLGQLKIAMKKFIDSDIAWQPFGSLTAYHDQNELIFVQPIVTYESICDSPTPQRCEHIWEAFGPMLPNGTCHARCNKCLYVPSLDATIPLPPPLQKCQHEWQVLPYDPETDSADARCIKCFYMPVHDKTIETKQARCKHNFGINANGEFLKSATEVLSVHPKDRFTFCPNCGKNLVDDSVSKE